MSRMTPKVICAAALVLASASVPALARAQPQPQSQSQSQSPPPIGAEVKDPKGASVGRVEKIIPGPDGTPRQVLVRVDRVLRALPVEALQRSGAAYVAVLTRPEIAALPPAD